MNETHLKSLLLIVDDEPVNLHILVEALGNDYRIKISTNGIDAIKIAQSSEKPDLIILDVMMPDLDGYEVCRILKQSDATKTIPVMFVTAMKIPEEEVRGLELGAVDYISKPIDIAVTKARVAAHIKMKHVQDQLLNLTNRDSLTGISNRYYFEEYFDNEWRRNRRDKTQLGLIMADVDHFKNYNDTYGYPAGDECLKKIATAFYSRLQRPGDLVARYVGEKFIGILSNTDLAGAHHVAESFRTIVENLKLPHTGSPTGYVTVSCGLTAMVPDISVLPSELILMADKNLSKAKASGRNIVISKLS